MRQALRVLLRSPGYSALVVLIIALGVGLNTALYSAVDAVLLTPVRYAAADRLVDVERLAVDPTVPRQPWTHAQFERLKEWEGSPFRNAVAYGTQPVTLAANGEPEQIVVEFVSRDYFEVLGVRLESGPGWLATTAAEPEIILTDALARRRADAATGGAPLTINGRPVRVAGTLPRRFRGESGVAEAFMPLDAAVAVTGETSLMLPFAGWLRVLARLADGTTHAAAEARLAAIDVGWEESGAVPVAPLTGRLAVTPLPGSRVHPRVREAVLLVGAASLVVLLIACLNVSSLMVARTSRRRREFAIRCAIGGNRRQLAGQLFAESLLLSCAGGLLGLLLAQWCIDALALLTPAETDDVWTSYARAVDFSSLRVDPRAMLFGFTVAAAAGLLIALLPALRAGGSATFAALRQGAATATRAQLRYRAAVLVLQTALALMLLTSAGLLLRSLQALHETDLGIDRHNVIAASFNLPRSSYDAARMRTFYATLLDRVRQEPGVLSASLSSSVPLGGPAWTGDAQVPGTTQEEHIEFRVHSASADHAGTVGLRMVHGRDLADGDGAAVLLNRTAATTLWPNDDPVGQTVQLGFPVPGAPLARVVGVVEDAQYTGIGVPTSPDIYVHSTLWTPRTGIISVRTRDDARAFAGRIRALVRDLDPDLAIVSLTTIDQNITRATSRIRFGAALFSTFAALATLLATLGIYALIAQITADSRRDTGVRLALGGSPRSVTALFLRRAASFLVLGIVAGAAASAAATRLLAAQLFAVSPLDPTAWLLGATLLAATALAAAALPALRAARTDPLTVLRSD